MQIAENSTNIGTRRSRVRVAREKIEQIRGLTAHHPFLKMVRLADVERDLAKIDQETDGFVVPEDIDALGLDELPHQIEVQSTTNLAKELIDSVNMSMLIARDSKSIENRRSNIALARHQMARLSDLAERCSAINIPRMTEVESDLIKIDLETDQLSEDYADPQSGMFSRSEAFLKLPLGKQCDQLGIPLDIIEMERAERCWIVSGTAHKRPENAALAHFKEQGWDGTACEGSAILMIMKAACLDYLAKVNTFGSREDACTRFFEAQCIIHRERSTEIIREIERADEGAIRANFREIVSQPMYSALYPPLDEEAVAAIWRALPEGQLGTYANYVLKDSGYRAGWPDLTLTQGKEIVFVEVKTTDRLHASQRDIILDILRPNNVDVRVLRIKPR